MSESIATAEPSVEAVASNGNASRGGALQRYVRDALATVGTKVADLSDEQRERALSAPTDRPTLRGKDLASFVMGGDERLEADREMRRVAAESKRSARKPTPRASNNPEWVAPAVTRGRHLSAQKMNADGSGPAGDNTTAYAGPIQHIKIRKVVTEKLGGEVTKDKILELAGMKSARALRDIATFKSGRESLRPLRPLGTEFGNDGWAKGRYLAAVLTVWIEDLSKSD